MKSFILYMIVSLSILSLCHAAQKRYWICERCELIHVGTTHPPIGKRCPATEYQNFHQWKEMEICHAKY